MNTTEKILANFPDIVSRLEAIKTDTNVDITIGIKPMDLSHEIPQVSNPYNNILILNEIIQMNGILIVEISFKHLGVETEITFVNRGLNELDYKLYKVIKYINNRIELSCNIDMLHSREVILNEEKHNYFKHIVENLEHVMHGNTIDIMKNHGINIHNTMSLSE